MNNNQYIIVTINPELGIGYFIGFNNGYPYFQSCIDKRVKCYRTFRNAQKQHDRINKIPDPPRNPATYKITAVSNDFRAWTPKRG